MDPEREDEVLRAAELYYYSGLTQEAIAERLGCTRWTVGRLLEQGRANGMVRITIRHPKARDHQLELEVQRRFGLRAAVVVATQATEAETAELVSRTAAEYFESLRPRPSSVAMGWGATEAAIAHYLPTGWARRLRVYQAMGGPGRPDEREIDRSVGEMARRGLGWATTISAPALAPSAESARRAVERGAARPALMRAASADIAVFAPRPIESPLFVDPDDVEQLERQGCVGSVLGHALDAWGRIALRRVEERTTAVPLGVIRRHPHTIAVCASPLATGATLAALRAGCARVVITDTASAERMARAGFVQKKLAAQLAAQGSGAGMER